MSDFIPLSVPSIQGNEWAYIKECLDTEWVSSVGSYVERFEGDIAAFTGARHAIACVNGTAAIHISLLLAGVAPGDEVIVPTVTFIAPVNAVRYCGAEPVFMDADEYYGIDAEKTMDFIRTRTEFRGGASWNRATGRRIAALLPVHVFGNAAGLDELALLCRERNIPVVEDATESLGTRYVTGALAGRHTGLVGRLGCISFNGNKIITTGGGGMILTDDDALAERARYLTTQAKDDGVRYVHHDVGYNFRLTNIQAALGVAQLERLPEYLRIKRRNYEAYKAALDAVPGLHVAEAPEHADNNLWMYALRIDARRYGRDREQTMAHLAANGIQSRPVWHLNHLQKPYAGNEAWRIERAGRLLEETLNIPCSVNLRDDDVARVISLLNPRTIHQ